MSARDDGLFTRLRPHMLGRPDGLLIRLRCAVLGHRWEGCYDDCCRGELCWCLRCHVSDVHLRGPLSASAIWPSGDWVGGFESDRKFFFHPEIGLAEVTPPKEVRRAAPSRGESAE